ncbi:ganglioside-induced differentiation-associated protein 1-like 1 isoform X2 [Myotis daubentonii]|uniref:ganglioside-induced differentiation-associated protein 1-like 1 isoform X2 n=1 Tax=Myotis daubentonii TaxID=98922 RepID=UPI002873363F|nr:ganglioside-induced differentiation-associated protein 1-like 1 isoform X2 [Myotis daubentonii]
MATPNNLTPTNCSWWPISALESDAAKPAEAPDAPQAASPAHWPKESLVLYHWTQSFSSQKVRLVIAEKGLACEERDVSLPQSEHKEPWFMRLNLGEEVPVIIHRDNIISDYDQIIDYVERTFTGEHVVALMPEAGSPQHARVLQYRELLDSLPMDAYTHGCILHPELTTDSMIPKYATAEIRRHLANATTDLMKLDHEEEPQLSEPYLSKQKKLMDRNVSCGSAAVPSLSPTSFWEPPCTASSSWDCPRNTGRTAAGPTCSPSLRGSRSALPSGKFSATFIPPCYRPSSPMHSGWSSGNRHLSLGPPSSWAPWAGWAILPTGTSRKNTSRAEPGPGLVSDCHCLCAV